MILRLKVDGDNCCTVVECTYHWKLR